MKAIESTFFIMKSNDILDTLLKMGRAEDAMQMQADRQFVLDNIDSPDPAMRAEAERMYQYLTQLQGYMGSDREMESPSRPKPMMANPTNTVPGQGARSDVDVQLGGEHEEPPLNENPYLHNENPFQKAWDALNF